MSKGVLLYAFDTPFNQYGKIASINAALIQRFLNLPVSVVTDHNTVLDFPLFDKVIQLEPSALPISVAIIDNGSWRVSERTGYFEHTPYEETLVLDCDYLQFNNRLLNLFGTSESLYLSYDAIQPNGLPMEDNELRISEFSLDLCWATCFYFRKDEKARAFFDYVEYVRHNYQYFTHQYELTQRGYRNDYVFSIASHLASDLTARSIYGKNPYEIVTGYKCIEIADIQETGLILHDSHNDDIYDQRNQSVHLLNKHTITERYDEFIRKFY